jgi:hypothetical protein
MKRWIQQILVLLAWLVNVLLGLWVMIALRQTLLATLAAWYIGDSIPRAWRVRFYDRAYFVIAGMVYLIFIFAVDGYLRDGLEKGDTFRRFIQVTAIALLILFPADVLTTLAQGPAQGPGARQLSLILITIDLLGGVALLIYALRKNPKRKRNLARRGTV